MNPCVSFLYGDVAYCMHCLRDSSDIKLRETWTSIRESFAAKRPKLEADTDKDDPNRTMIHKIAKKINEIISKYIKMNPDMDNNTFSTSLQNFKKEMEHWILQVLFIFSI